MIKPTIELLKFRKSATYYQLSDQYQYNKATNTFVTVGLVLSVFDREKIISSHDVTDITECTKLKQYLTDD